MQTANTLDNLILNARKQSFNAGLRAGDYSLRRQLNRAHDEIHQLKIRIATLQAELDNTRGRADW